MVHPSLLELDCPIFPIIFWHESKTAAWAFFTKLRVDTTWERKNCYFWVNCSFNFWSVLAGSGYNTHSVAQIFRLENMAWPPCIRRDQDHVSGPFFSFCSFFPKPIVSIFSGYSWAVRISARFRKVESCLCIWHDRCNKNRIPEGLAMDVLCYI